MTARAREEGSRADTSPTWGEKRDRVWKSVLSSSKEGRLLITFLLRVREGRDGREGGRERGKKEGRRETFLLLPFSYRVMKSLLRGRRRLHRRRSRSRSVGRRRKTGQSIGIDRLRELGEWTAAAWPRPAGELIKRMCEKEALLDDLSPTHPW